MGKKNKKPVVEKEIDIKVLALKNFCNISGKMIKKDEKTTISQEELTNLKQAKAIKEL